MKHRWRGAGESILEQDGFPKGLRPFGGVQRQSLWRVRAAPGEVQRQSLWAGAGGSLRGRGESGLTLVEMLCATALLTLLALILNAGIGLAVRSYRTMVARSETELLLSTAAAALADDLRYARGVEVSGETFTYTSDSFGKGTALELDSAGRIVAQTQTPDGPFHLLPVGREGDGTKAGGAYHGSAYQFDDTVFQILYDPGTNTFTIHMKVVWTEDTSVSAETPDEGLCVRCLNPKKTTEGEETP